MPNAPAKPCPEGALVLISWFSRRVAAGRSSRLSCRVLPDASRPGERSAIERPRFSAVRSNRVLGSLTRFSPFVAGDRLDIPRDRVLL
jgi:hypothetical protein